MVASGIRHQLEQARVRSEMRCGLGWQKIAVIVIVIVNIGII